MNGRIDELWEQCKTPLWSKDVPIYDHRLFAELIVTECLTTIAEQATLDTNEDFREGFSHGRKLAWTDIRHNFGVK